VRQFKKVLLLCSALLLSAGAFAATTVIHGVKIEDSATVAGVSLQLNGAGTRYKGPFKIYVGDLYTTRKVASFEELVAAPGPNA
jgi:hypothetical protein